MNAAKENNLGNQTTPSLPSIRILKIGTCPSLSGNSTLTYHLGCTEDAEIMFRVYANSAAGFFSNEWISMNSIQQVSNTIPLDKPITSFLLLNTIYIGRSQNSPGFMLAVLKSEGLVVPVEGNERVYLRTDGIEFFAEVKALMESGVDIKVDDKPKQAVPGKKSDDKPKKSAQIIAGVPIKKSASKPGPKNPI